MLVPAAPASAPIPFLIAAGVLSSFGLVIWRITQVSLRQAITPDHMLGRVNAVSRFMMWGTIPLGTLLGGALGSTIGLRDDPLDRDDRRVVHDPAGAVLARPHDRSRSRTRPKSHAEAVLEPTIGMAAVGMDETHA